MGRAGISGKQAGQRSLTTDLSNKTGYLIILPQISLVFIYCPVHTATLIVHILVILDLLGNSILTKQLKVKAYQQHFWELLWSTEKNNIVINKIK